MTIPNFIDVAHEVDVRARLLSLNWGQLQNISATKAATTAYSPRSSLRVGPQTNERADSRVGTFPLLSSRPSPTSIAICRAFAGVN